MKYLQEYNLLGYHVSKAKHHVVTRIASWNNPTQQIPGKYKLDWKLQLLCNQLQSGQAELICYCVNRIRCLLSGNKDHDICSKEPF